MNDGRLSPQQTRACLSNAGQNLLGCEREEPWKVYLDPDYVLEHVYSASQGLTHRADREVQLIIRPVAVHRTRVDRDLGADAAEPALKPVACGLLPQLMWNDDVKGLTHRCSLA